MEAKNIIGIILLAFGMFLAIGTADGSNMEIALRFAGVVLCGGAGACFGYKKNEKEDGECQDED